MIRNLFPQDTRIAEFISAFGLVLIVLFMSEKMSVLTTYHEMPFWAILFMALGSLQLWALYDYPRMELLRCIVSWVNGSLWIWIAFISFGDISPNDLVAALVGVTNLYSFSIGFLSLRHKWAS